jgi:hypothetical protein
MTIIGPRPNVDLIGKEELCGVEHLLYYEIRKVLKATRLLSIRRVLELQEQQRTTGKHDTDAIASVYQQASQFPRTWRRAIACLNAEET